MIITPYFTSGHQSSSCKGTCTDVIRIQTQNDFCCFPSLTFEPLHYLLNFKVFFTLIMAALLSRCGHYIFALWFLSSIFYLFLFLA